MDPAILNYLQSQQSMGQTPQGQATQGVTPQGQAYNPFDIGISRAVDSARQSLGMTDKQQDKALRRSLLTFADNMSQQPKQRGFFNNFGSVSKALSPAIGAYDTAEDEALTQNNKLANEILQYKAAEEKKITDAEYNDWYKKHAEAQLAEQSRAHNMTAAYQQQKLQSNQSGSGSKAWEYQAKHNITKIIPEITTKYENNEHILPVIDEFKQLLENSKLTGSSKVAELKRFIARQTGQDESILDAKNMGQFYLEWLGENTKGVLSDKDIAVYSAGFADIEKNPKAAVKVLERQKKKLITDQEIYTRKLNEYERDPGSNLSRINIINRNINAVNKNKEVSLPQTEIKSNSQKMIKMVHRDGREAIVPDNDIEAIKDLGNDGFNEI